MGNVQISQELFMQLLRFHLVEDGSCEKEIKQGLEKKLDRMVMRDLYGKFKTAPTEEERERARKEYLDDAVETYKVFENLKSIEGASMELFVPKPLVYKAKRQTPATEHQKERLRELLEQYGRKDSISWETLTRSEASRLQDKIRAGNF